MKFKIFNQSILTPAAGIILTGLSSCGNDQQLLDSPYNVLIIGVDDMNNYGFYHEYPVGKTPGMDDFRNSAVTFSNAYCAAPVCTPSRAAFYSGMYPHTTGAYWNGSDPWRLSEPLIDCETMPECFKRNGYTTWGRGKIFHAKLEEGRIERNFDNDQYGGGFGPFPDSAHQIKGRFWGIQAFADSAFPDVKNADAAIEFLNEDHDKPFFMTFGLWRPHTPFTCPQRFYDLYDPDQITIPEGYMEGDIDDIPEEAKKLLDPFGRFNPGNKQEWKELIHAYMACTSFADWNVGRVLSALDSSRYAKNTIVVFWSDNGYHCGEKNHWEKNTLWEQASRVPFAIRIPGSGQNGKVCREPINLVDVYATLADYCNLQTKEGQLQGQSLADLLSHPGKKRSGTSLTTFGEGFAGITDGRYRYIVYGDGSEELYDHKKDPYEFNNLAGNPKYEKVIERFRKFVPDQFAKSLDGRRS